MRPELQKSGSQNQIYIKLLSTPDQEEATKIELSDVKLLKYVAEDGNNITLASSIGTLHMFNSQQNDIGRIYLAVKDKSALINLYNKLSTAGLEFRIKVSPETNRLDQICVYFSMDALEMMEKFAIDVLNVLREFYKDNKENIIKGEIPLALTLLNKEGIPMTGINFKQGTDVKDSPNSILAEAIYSHGNNLKKIKEFLFERGYDKDFPALSWKDRSAWSLFKLPNAAKLNPLFEE